MPKKYIVTLTPVEREQLLSLINTGTAKARTLTHARILLKADENCPDLEIRRALHVSIPTIERIRKRFVFEGCAAVLKPHRPHRIYSRKLDGEQEAHTIALVCGAPPSGYSRWSLRLLAERVVQLNIVESISHETIRQVLAQNELKPWRKQEWCIPPRANAKFVYPMEDIWDVYKRPVNPQRPLVCFDETPEQLISETRPTVPMQSGQPQRYDFEYRREGVANLFMFFAPLQNWRTVKVTAQRTQVDWAHCMRDLVEIYFPHAEKIVLVQDQLNTHTPASLYEVFAPDEAKRLLDRFEFHATPKHGSWLNMAEIELSVLNRQCLRRCIPSHADLIRETQTWVRERNQKQVTVDWQFAAPNARIKLKRLYPSIQH